MNHTVEKCPEQYVRAESSEESVGQETFPGDEILLPIGAGFEQQHAPQPENGQHVEQESDYAGQPENT